MIFFHRLKIDTVAGRGVSGKIRADANKTLQLEIDIPISSQFPSNMSVTASFVSCVCLIVYA